jgi:predicted MFS family arabinose efflux permease
MTDGAARLPATYRSVMAVAEFRRMWLAHAQSRAGDQLGRVALAVLVYGETRSALWTGVTYALTYLPPLIGAPLLGGLADRYPRRTVLVFTDLWRMFLFAVMALPHVPLPLMAVLLVLALGVQPLYSASRNGIIPAVLSGDRYVVGFSLIELTDSIAQVAGFACGGLLVAAIGPHPALAADAVTFALSALLIRFGLRPFRPAGSGTPAPIAVSTAAAKAGKDSRLRSLALLIWCYGWYLAPEGVAAPYAHQLGLGAPAVGLLMAADPIGAGLGALAIGRWVRPAALPRLITPLAVASGLPLVLSALYPSLPLAVGLWTVVGVLTTYTMVAHTTFVRLVPDERRGRTVALLSAGLQSAQGLGVAAAGGVADVLRPSFTVAVFGAVGICCTAVAGLAWNRARRCSQPGGSARTSMEDNAGGVAI